MKPARGKVRPSPSPAAPPPDLRLAMFFLWVLVLVPPLVFVVMAKESFRQPKLLAYEWLALASLAALAWSQRRAGGVVRPADLWRLPAVRMVLPALAVATAGLAWTAHPAHAREGLIDFWIGAAALVGWSAVLAGARLERLLRGLFWPATVLALVGTGQFHGVQPLGFLGLAPGSRLAITSLAGNPGDLAAFLVLPVLLAQMSLRRQLREGEGWRRPALWGTAAALALCLYALLLTQTLAAVAAVGLGSLLLWGALLPRRWTLAALAGGGLAMVLLVAAVAPLRQRVLEKAHQAASGDLNAVLTGRLDGWHTAIWMLREHPLTGVGHGAYRPEFVPAKLALIERGVPFSVDQLVGFGNAHNEYLEVAAEWGIPGVLALGWGLWVLLTVLRRRQGERGGERRALAWAGTAAFAVLALVDFPFRVALVAFPALLFLSWVLRGEEETA